MMSTKKVNINSARVHEECLSDSSEHVTIHLLTLMMNQLLAKQWRRAMGKRAVRVTVRVMMKINCDCGCLAP